MKSDTTRSNQQWSVHTPCGARGPVPDEGHCRLSLSITRLSESRTDRRTETSETSETSFQHSMFPAHWSVRYALSAVRHAQCAKKIKVRAMAKAV
jgi:hypothetical protein